MPKVTVLMAVYNGERYLSEAVASILAQTYGDFEFLIIDDGSTDRSRELILSYGDPRIRLLANDRNLGLSRSLNRGLGLARGEYVARLDADDVSKPERLAKQVAYLDAHADVALLGTWYKEIDADGVEIGEGELPCDYHQILWSLWFFCPFVHSAVTFRRSVIPGRVGSYDEALSYSMDYELWSRVARQFPVANLGEFLVQLRTNPWSMTATYGARTREGVRIRIAALADLLGWDPGTIEANESRFDALVSLATGIATDLRPDEVEQAVTDLAQLQRHFYQIHDLERAYRRAFSARLYARIGSSIAGKLSGNRHNYSLRELLRLLPLACRLYPPVLLARRGVGILARAVAPTMTRACTRYCGGRPGGKARSR